MGISGQTIWHKTGNFLRKQKIIRKITYYEFATIQIGALPDNTHIRGITITQSRIYCDSQHQYNRLLQPGVSTVFRKVVTLSQGRKMHDHRLNYVQKV